METIIEKEPERCTSTPVTGREAGAGPDQVASGTAGTGQERTTYTKIRGDLAFYLYDRQERISDRLNKKIERLGRRITALEERGGIMPRRQTTVEREIPLFIVPHMIMERIRKYGEEVEWMEAKRVENHFYTVRIRTRPVNREFQSLRAKAQTGTKRRAV